MSDEDLIKLWNSGLTKLGVAKEYMKDHNRKSKNQIDIKRISLNEALTYVEPILFKYRMKQLKN